MLQEFIHEHREELIELARSKVAMRAIPRATYTELVEGVPIFLTQLGSILAQEATASPPDGTEMSATAMRHGRELLEHGFSIAMVVHDYGDLCQAITELAVNIEAPLTNDDFNTLNRCLDNAIASAVTEYSRQRDADISGAEAQRLGFFAHELRNHLNTATLSFQAVKSGRFGVTSSTFAVLERSLTGLRDLIDRSVSEVRLTSGTHQRRSLRVGDLIEELEIQALMEATHRGLRFSVECLDRNMVIDVDRQLFASALSNLVQNAFKYTRPSTHVTLTVRGTRDHVTIEVADECGGLPPGAAEAIFRPFVRRSVDREGLGLGLSISRRAIELDAGTIAVQDIPGKGCIFIVEMPRGAAAAASN